MFKRKVSMVYIIASKLGKRSMSYDLACKIAEHFSIAELDRIYKAVSKGVSHAQA